LLHKYASDIETMTNNNIGKKEEKEWLISNFYGGASHY
jgi:hypothetical protein